MKERAKIGPYVFLYGIGVHVLRVLDDLRQWFRAHLESQRRFGMTRGCPLGTIGNQITEDDNLTQQDLKLIFVVMHNKLATFFIREKAKGLLSKYASEDDMADFCIAAIQGAMLMGKIRRSSETVETIGQEALAPSGRTPYPLPG